MMKRILGMLLTLLMLASLLPAAWADWTVPEDYGEDEYNRLAAFLETEDESGVKNGTKLNADYDVDDPSTWGDGWVFFPFGDTPFHVMMIGWDGREIDGKLVGELNVSGFPSLIQITLEAQEVTAVYAANCPELGNVDISHGKVRTADFSYCESLEDIMCDHNELTSLNVSGCTGLGPGIFCSDNLLTELDVSDCTQLMTLDCGNNRLEMLDVRNCAALSTLNAQNNALTSIDLSGCTSLNMLNLSGNRFKSIDISACPKLHLNTVTAVGPGTVGYFEAPQSGNTLAVFYAYPNESALFLGWYDSSDTLLSTDEVWDASSVLDSIGTDVTAKFKWNLPDGVYLVGTMNEWAPTEADKFSANPNNDGEYMLETSLGVGDEIKVIRSVGGNWTWYPGDDNYVVDAAHSGNVTIYFRNTYNSAWYDFGGHFYIAAKHSVSLTTVGSGTASFAPAAPATGAAVTLTVTPEEGSVYDYTEIYKITGEGENDKELVELGSLQWNDDELSFEMPDYDIQIVVYFKLRTFTVTFDANGGSGTMESIQCVPGQSIQLPACVFTPPEGMCFGGWQAGSDPELKEENEPITPTGDLTVKAIWHYAIKILETENGTVTADKVTAAVGDTVTLTVTPDPGYALLSLTRVTGDEDHFTEITEKDEDGNYIFAMPAGRVSVNARFARICTVGFDAQGGSVDPETIVVTAGGSIETLPTPTRTDGWVFVGWYMTPAEKYLDAGKGTPVTTATTFSADTTVYAHWRLPGDVNGDAQVNFKDLTRLQRYLKYHDVEVVVPNLDVNGDDTSNFKDLTRLQRFLKYQDVDIF